MIQLKSNQSYIRKFIKTLWKLPNGSMTKKWIRIHRQMAALALGHSSSSTNLDQEILTLLYNSAKILESKITESAIRREGSPYSINWRRAS